MADFPIHADTLVNLPERLDRSVLREVCAAAVSDEHAAERAFVVVMAWGYGKEVGYGRYRTQEVLRNTPNAAEKLLIVARTLAESGPLKAYSQLATTKDCRLRGLGPAFGTKYLYFCQPADQYPVALIFDSLVSKWLLREARFEMPSLVWKLSVYRSYLERMHEWAAALMCRPDEVEYCIFRTMAAERGSQWGAGT